MATQEQVARDAGLGRPQVAGLAPHVPGATFVDTKQWLAQSTNGDAVLQQGGAAQLQRYEPGSLAGPLLGPP